MDRHGTLATGLALSGLLILGTSHRPRLDAQTSDAPRLVAIGDIHGAYAQLVSLLKHIGIVDDRIRWAAGRTTVVQTGDFTDRGASVRPAMDLLMTLERQAEAA